MRFRLKSWLSGAYLTVSICFAVWAGNALAAAPNPNAFALVSNEFWLGLLFSVLFALLAGYAKGLDNRVKGVEIEQKQQATAIYLIREQIARDHPTKSETAEHRRFVEDQLRHIMTRLDNLSGSR